MTEEARPWGLRDAVVGYLVGLSTSILLGGIWFVAVGEGGLGFAAVSLVGLWIGLAGTPLWLSARRGTRSLADDFQLRIVPSDIPVGIGAAVGVQVLVPLLYLPLQRLAPELLRDLERPARELVDDAGRGSLAFAGLAVLIVVGAPFAEELFFRGLLQSVLRRRWGTARAIAGSAVAFGLAHFEVIQFPALFVLGLVLGWLVARRDRLGPALIAHGTFNAITMAVLWATR